MPRLRAVGALAQADIYPMAFMGNNFVNNIFGFGFEFSYASVFPESEISAADGTVAGKLATVLTDMRIDVIARALYMKNKMSSEIRLLPYLKRDVKQTYKGDSTADAPLANFTATGMGVAITQRFRVSNSFRISGAALLPVNLKGTTVDSAGAGSVPLAQVSGYSLDLGFDYGASAVKIYGNFRMEKFSGSGISIDPQTNAESAYKLAANKYVAMVGMGFAL